MQTHWLDETQLYRYITPELLAEAVPDCIVPDVWAPVLDAACMAVNLRHSELPMLLAQLGHESLGFNRLQENLNYSVDGLLKTFSRHRISEADARRYGRAPGRPANQKAIANIIYGGEWGRQNLGNTQPDDGWFFRGHGLIHTTGRANYRLTQGWLGKWFRYDAADLMVRPAMLTEPHLAAAAALCFWRERVTSPNDLRLATRQINGGYNGIDDREQRLDQARKALKGGSA